MLVLLLLIPLILLAGCTKTVTELKTGLVIEKFSPEISTVPSNSQIGFTLVVKNTGEATAQRASAFLTGMSGWTFVNDRSVKDIDPRTLSGSNKELGFEGERGIVTWSLRAPIVESDQTYTPIVFVSYLYSTSSTILIKGVSLDYFKSLPEEEQQKIGSGVTIVKSTAGPITVSVKSQQALVSGGVDIPIEIEFKNEGGGNVAGRDIVSIPKKEEKEADINKIRVTLSSNVGFRCEEYKRQSGGEYLVKLVQGKTGRLLCFVTLREFQGTQSFSLELVANYWYIIEGKSSVKVSKSLYVPPILDISVQDSTQHTEHIHNTGVYDIIVDAKVTNVGNQPVADQVLLIVSPDKIPSISIPEKCQWTVTPKFRRENPEARLCMLRYPNSIREVPVNILSDSLTKEQNTGNNRLSIPVTVSYDISAGNLKADRGEGFDVNIAFDITNRGNVIAKGIPFVVTVDKESNKNPQEISCTVSGTSSSSIGTLSLGGSVPVTCTYKNPLFKTGKIDIQVNIPEDPMEDTDEKRLNSQAKTSFLINYILRLSNSAGKIKDISVTADLKSLEFSYDLTTTVTNNGDVEAKRSRVDFLDTSKNSLCTTFLVDGKEIDPVKSTDNLQVGKSKTISCITKKIRHQALSSTFDKIDRIEEKLDVNAVIIGTPTDSNTKLAEEPFEVKLKLLALANVIEPSFSAGISKSSFPGAGHQSFTFSKRFTVTKIYFSLEGDKPKDSITAIIRNDKDSFPDTVIDLASVVQKTEFDDKLGETNVYRASFAGNINLDINKPYWITLCPGFRIGEVCVKTEGEVCTETKSQVFCDGDSGLSWKYSRTSRFDATPVDIYSGGFGRFTNLNSLENNGDFGFKVYGIEK